MKKLVRLSDFREPVENQLHPDRETALTIAFVSGPLNDSADRAGSSIEKSRATNAWSNLGVSKLRKSFFWCLVIRGGTLQPATQ